jgi:hypothetical protein
MKTIEYLKSFNRKERFHLVGQLLGNSRFNLDPNMFRKILDLLNLDTPTYYFSAMDYHLDWIFASLSLASGQDDGPKEINSLCINATNEDIDFLLAFVDDLGITHIIMIEAKGDTSFTNKQLQSKANRLNEIFGPSGKKWPNVVPHFLVCSPTQPSRLQTSTLPSFMRNKKDNGLAWFRLYMPANQRKVTRCDASGNTSKNGTHWKIKHIRTLKN